MTLPPTENCRKLTFAPLYINKTKQTNENDTWYWGDRRKLIKSKDKTKLDESPKNDKHARLNVTMRVVEKKPTRYVVMPEGHRHSETTPPRGPRRQRRVNQSGQDFSPKCRRVGRGQGGATWGMRHPHTSLQLALRHKDFNRPPPPTTSLEGQRLPWRGPH